VICQHGIPEHLHAGGLARARYGTPDIAGSGRIDARDSLPGVPRDVSVELVCVVIRHRPKPLLTPGAIPGIQGTGGGPACN